MNEIIIQRNNYISYELDNLIDLHENIKNNYKLLSIFNKSESCKFIQIILDNLIFKELNNEIDSEEEEYYDT
tara:strand:+ start:827 stop:1042 length:216 start_codon:yes stop_codon:yes gene_type:complete